MAAEKIKQQQITRGNKKPTPKQTKILTTKQDHPNLTTREIAAICNTDHSHVSKTLQAYEINKQHVIKYKNNRADVFADLQHRLVSSITDDEIQKAPIGTRILATAQLYDKERLERGQSTENIAQIHADIAKLREVARNKSESNDE